MKIARIVLTLLLLLAGWKVWQRKAALELAARPSATNLERAISRDRLNPDLHMRLGRLERDSVVARNESDARRHMERAVELRPKSATFLAELGALYESMGLMSEAEATLQRALDLNPRDAPYIWRLANLKLRLAATEEAVALFGDAMARDPSLAEAGAAILLKSGVDPARVQRLWPTGPGIEGRLLDQFLRLRSKAGVSIAHSVLADQWDRALEDPENLAPSRGSLYFNYLADSARYEELHSAWTAFQARQGLVDAAYSDGLNRLWNGDFELPHTPGLLAWRLRKAGEWEIAREPGLAEDGSTALTLEFRGVTNNFAGLRQQFVALGGTRLALSARIASEALDGRPLYFEIYDPTSRETLAALPVGGGTMPWTGVRMEFGPVEATRILRLTLRSDARGQAPALSGRLVLDKLAIRPLATPPDP